MLNEGKARGRRVLDVEDVVRWVYRDELPKLAREGSGLGIGGSSISPMFRICDLGVRVDDWSHGEPVFPAAMGECHPDALKVQAAVDALGRFQDQTVDDLLELGPDFGASPEDEAEAMRRAFGTIDTLVINMARMPMGPQPALLAEPADVLGGQAAERQAGGAALGRPATPKSSGAVRSPMRCWCRCRQAERTSIPRGLIAPSASTRSPRRSSPSGPSTSPGGPA